MPALCRDCLTTFESARHRPRCPACRSPRLIAHPELFDLSIAHMDCDAFYASVEKRDDPALRDHPVIVGGGQRGVVSTACYIARIRGVRSRHADVPGAEALPRGRRGQTPDGAPTSPPPRRSARMMEALTPPIEPLSLDEAFLDLTGTARLHGAPPAVLLARLVKRMETSSASPARSASRHNKFLAKVASRPRQAARLLGDRPGRDAGLPRAPSRCA